MVRLFKRDFTGKFIKKKNIKQIHLVVLRDSVRGEMGGKNKRGMG